MLFTNDTSMIKIIVSVTMFELTFEPHFNEFHVNTPFYSCITIRKHFRANIKNVKNKGTDKAITAKSPEKDMNRSNLVGRKGLYMMFPFLGVGRIYPLHRYINYIPLFIVSVKKMGIGINYTMSVSLIPQ